MCLGDWNKSCNSLMDEISTLKRLNYDISNYIAKEFHNETSIQYIKGPQFQYQSSNIIDIDFVQTQIQVMQSETISIWDIIKACKKVSTDHCRQIFQQIVKWMFFQFKSDHHVAFGRIGNYGYKIQEKSKQKIPILFFNQTYLKQANLKLTTHSFLLKPLVKINSNLIASHCNEKIKKQQVEIFYDFLLGTLDKCLKSSSSTSFNIDLDILGRIVRRGNEVDFQYFLPKTDRILQSNKNMKGKTTLRSFIEKEAQKSQIGFNKMNILTNKESFLPKIQRGAINQVVQQKRPAIRKRTSSKDRKVTSRDKQERELKNETLWQRPSSKTKRSLEKSIRSISLKSLGQHKKDTLIGSQMMGAGNDPLKKQHDYAKLISDPKELMKTTFVFQKSSPDQNIPIIDEFSRTLACPIATQRQNPLVAARIGSNISIEAQGFDITSEGIKNLIIKADILENRVQKPEEEKKFISEKMQYELVIKQVRTPEQEKILELRRRYFASYIRLFDHIQDRHIAQITKTALTNILGSIDSKYQNPFLIEQMLDEIFEGHKNAIKKSIIDYIVMDLSECQRLSLYIKYKQVPLYGSVKSNYGTMNMNSLYRIKKPLMQQKIMKNSQFFLIIQKIWYEKYHGHELIVLPPENNKYLHIDDFLQSQKLAIKKVRDLIINEWMPILANIYRDQISALNRNQKKCVVFFDTAAMLLALQIRELVEKGMNKLKQYIKQYDQQLLNPPDTVVYLEKTANKYEKCFLNIRISHRKDEIYFMDSMSQMKQKILSIVDLLRVFSETMPRPQNLITKTSRLFLLEMATDDHFYLQTRKFIDQVVEKNLNNVVKALEIFNEYKYLLIESRTIQAWILNGKHDRRQYSITFLKYSELYDQVMDKIPSFIRMNMVNIDSSQLKNYLLKCASDIIKMMEKSVYQLVMSKNNDIKTELQKMISTVTSKAETCEQLVLIEDQIQNYKRNGIRKLQQKNVDLIKWISITLYNTLYPPTKDDLDLLYSTANFLHKIHEKLDEYDSVIFAQRKRFQGQVHEDHKYYNVRLKELLQKVDQMKEFGSKMLRDSALQLLKEARNDTTLYTKFIENLNDRQKLLGVEQTSPSKIYEVDRILKPFEQLWNLVKDYYTVNQSWTKDSIFKLNSDDIDFQVKKMYKSAVQLSNNPLILKIAPLTLKVAQQLIEEIKNFQNNIPIISVFSNPGLKERHFQQISTLIKYEGEAISRKSNLYLNKLVSMGVSQYIEQLQNISEVASKEYMIETTLKKITNEWKQMQFQMKQYKDTGVMILTGACLEEIQVLLDDHSLKMITMKGSLYAKTFEERLTELDEWLNYTNDMIEYSIKVQSTWMYLEPVMTSPDILKHLSVEGTKFRVVDQVWRDITKQYKEKSLITEITKNRTIVEKLKDSYKNLEVVLKGLNSYLQSKRLSFPRFFFLSNEELLEILSETKNPMRVQPHLKKCFEGISKLQFEDQKVILGMFSDEEQYVEFGIKIDTVLARGNVDQWLLQVENRMIRAVKNQITKCHTNNDKLSRKQSLLATCAMSVITVQMTNWTHKMQIKIQQQKIEDGVKQTQKDLNEIIELIKGSKNLKKVNIITLEALIVLSVHNLDIANNLNNKNIQYLSNFEWESQMRYYYREFPEFNNQEKTEVKILNAICEFCHQYLGNTSRLVITPLTDRCYRTLCSAIFLNYGGAPQGPAGTGKTETVKDLAKALACQCVVFNCSDGLDYKAMGKFFKGLAASGAWSCFDQFNRINLEVLSVVAQQILSIQTAKAQKLKVLFFQDAQIKLKTNANCFITMNPGYAGRSELPDNLKALFRPVAMMIPDYAMIAEISLYSYGFTNARNLARKIVSTYKLCSQQLSSQQHYDYGMRAVKSVLVAAGSLKRKYQDLDENSLILKAINDVNVAKFLNFDIPLFNGITSDLFKDVEVPKINYNLLIEKILEIFEECNLCQSDYALQKIIQIYDMVLVRHGLMVVGYPFSGKTTALQVLAEALKRCKTQMNENQVQLCKINPKAITMKQLYGYFDEISHEWFDGVLAVKFRNFASSTTPSRKWLILDGPVDAIWIENMNTVLDDNKKLCLNSGEIIAMNRSMSLVFQPMDLLAASPATVSRCGMIYMESGSLGYNVLIDSWIRNNSWLSLELIVILKDFFKILPLLYTEIKNSMRMVCYTEIFFLTQTLLRLLSVQLKPIRTMMEDSRGKQQLGQQKNSFKLISTVFGFSCIWSFGGCVDTKSRRLFDYSFKKIVLGEIIMNNKKRKTGYPEKGQLYDYVYNMKTEIQNFEIEWMKWVEMIPEESKRERSIDLHKIKVKTADSIKYNHLLNYCIQENIPILLCGPTGTGKTTAVKQYKNLINKTTTSFLQIVFSSRTSCNQVTEQIESVVDKKGAKSIIGPKKNNMVIYIDDINMPIKEQYGAQPPIQFLRQLVDQKGFYDFHEKQRIFKRLVDVTFVYCMASLNNEITPRFLRHSNLISITNFDDDTLQRIFSTILGISFEGSSQYKNISNILKNSIELYNECVKTLKPTPNKSHYIFNLRDLSKLIIGICRVDKAKVNSENIGRLWAHQCRRVFVDRLLPEDKPLIEKIMIQIGKKWGKNMNEAYFSSIISSSHEPSYQEISDLEKVNLSVTTALNNYNLVSDKPMNLVLFNYALQHILIALRIITEPKGNALLVGLGGSGRKSFSSLATFIAQYSPFSLEITKNYGFTQFREDMKKMCIQIGVKNRQICFTFTDSMIKDEQFLEDINNILNIGKIPNLFNSEERIEICENVRKDAVNQTGQQMNLQELYQFFEQRVSNSLKLILCFSPIGDAFRTRMRMFPSLVNCTTIDWYTEWPSSGLVSVARQFLSKVDLKQKQNYIKMFEFLHSNAKEWSEIFYKQLKRKFYVTPTSFIEFITTFKQLLSKKRKSVKQLIYKYENGHIKIIETEKEVEKMQKSLEEMKPEIKQAAEDTAFKMELVKVQKQEADQIMVQISGEEKIVLEAVNQANAIKEQCEKELAVALPQLKAAENALMVLDKSSLTQLKSMNAPPPGVRLTLQGLCLLIQPNPKQKMKNEKTLKMETDWWAASMRVLNNPKLLNQLVNFNKDALTENMVNNLGKFLNDPNNKEVLTVANVAKSSVACQCIFQWVTGIYNFYFVNKRVKPKKQSLKQAEEKVNGLNKKLDAKRSQLQKANDKVEQLNYELEWAQKKKQRLQKQYAECEISLERAEIIMKSLGSQKQRWLKLSEDYKQQEQQVDMIIFMSTAQIIYFGPFTQAFRTRILKDWLPKFKENHLDIGQNFSLINSLGNAVQIRGWNLNGLPYDNFSVENALIIYNSRRWPLMIDPQGQANKWLKKQELERKIKVTKPFEDSFIRNLQNCIQFGNPALIENLGQQINAALTPILLKQTYKKGATTYLKMGQNLLIYSQDFFLYMTTKLSNPHYLPEVCTQVVLINFMITEEGLNDQLLALIVSLERPDLQAQKEKLTIESANNQKILKQIEDKILDILGNSENILADQTAINVLSASKEKSNEIVQKQVISQETQLEIDQARSQYISLSEEGSNLFFVVSALENLDLMYRYSLTYFTDLYRSAVNKSEQSDSKEERLENIRKYFRLSLFRNIGRSLFQKDRMIFSALMALKLDHAQPKVIEYLSTNNEAITVQSTLEKPKQEWLTESIWRNMIKISEIPEFENLLIAINEDKNKRIFENILKSSNPYSEKLPPLYQSYDFLYKLIIMKMLRPDKMLEGFTNYIAVSIGNQFAKALPFDLTKIYPDSTSSTPILFILSAGSDPFISITNFSKSQQIPMDSISLGQGQGAMAERLISKNIENGGWIILQNCHLATSWMSSLEKIVQQLEDSEKQIHKNFRLWLTSYPSEQFPQSVLQKSLKVTNEPAKGLKNNLMVSYLSDPINDSEYFQGSLLQKPFKKLLYSLTFFHAVIQERRKFGPLGWNISYEFSDSDLRISCKQLKIYLDSAGNQNNLPFEALNYLIAQCNYGGRVTDQNDRRLLETLLKEIFNDKVFDSKHNYGNTDEYILPQLKRHEQFLEYIESLPQFTSPELVGLHLNADITKDYNQSNQILDSILKCVSSEGGAIDGQSTEQKVMNIIDGILNDTKFPELYDAHEILKKYPILYEQSMNTVLNQQIGRYNKLIQQIRKTLELLKKSISGEQVMTQSLQKMFRSMTEGKVPEIWLNKSYPSLKPLGSYIADLIERTKFFDKWINKGTPKKFWLSGFFFTQSYLTGILQNYSRKNQIPVDELAFQYIFEKQKIESQKDGANVFGLFIEGAGWNHNKEVLEQSQPGQLFVECPNIYLKPQKTENYQDELRYNAPLYKTVVRRGVLSTTGHSTNFVMMIKMPTQVPESHWTKRGVALLTQTNF